jgi:hypothetical protein
MVHHIGRMGDAKAEFGFIHTIECSRQVVASTVGVIHPHQPDA